MRRLLVIFLLLIFPLEMTFAAVDPCCNYSASTRHAQCIDAENAGQAVDPGHKLSSVDQHCALCALGVIACLPQAARAPLTPIFERDVLSSSPPRTFASWLAPRPDRPQWFALA